MARKKRVKADRVGELIAEYRAVVPDAKGNSFRKSEIIEYGLLSLKDERLLPFFLELAGDRKDYDLARCALFKHLGWKFRELRASAEQREVFGRTIARVMTDPDEDTLVRNYATQAAGSFSDVPEVFAAASSFLLNADEDVDIRFGALAVVQARGPTKEALDVLSAGVSDVAPGGEHEALLRRSAEELLQKYKARKRRRK